MSLLPPSRCIVHERVLAAHRDVRIGLKIPGGIEEGIGLPAFVNARFDEMLERRDVEVQLRNLREIKAVLEQWMRVMRLPKPRFEVVQQRIHTDSGRIPAFP